MSKTVDERVVEMRFDNKQFESNVATSMSTLDKLKQSLNLTGAVKGFDNISSAAKKVDMSGLGNGIETVSAKFSALEVMGVTALANITNSAVNAGKRLVKSLTIDPIKQGWNEYELKMGSVQTIMASTGESLETVNAYLDELNTYADKTIYSFSDMTNNIGKFTNAGVGLKDSVKAIQGISNEAAVSGANAQQASHAMYNFAQALSAGYVKLIDWKSIENANMATVEFKNQLLETAVACGTLTKGTDGMYETLEGHTISATRDFNEYLKDQWMTTEVLVKTLGDYADETTDIGKKAFAAAQDVKTFSQLIDTLKEAVGSGWARSFEIIFGDFNEAKELFTGLSNVIGGFIDRISSYRNAILESSFGTKIFSGFSKSISSIVKPINKAVKTAKGAIKTLKQYEEMANRVIRGDFGNQGDNGDRNYRKKKVEAAGYEYAKVQNIVNEKLGVNIKLTEKAKESQKDLNSEKEKTTKADAKYIAKLVEMSDAELKNLGYTEDQIEAFRTLGGVADELGIPIEKFIKNMDEIDGRWLIIDSFKNIGKAISAIVAPIKEAWVEIFPPERIGESIFNLIAAFHKLTSYIKVSENTSKNIKRIFKGIFSIFSLVSRITGGALSIGFKILCSILKVANMDILEFAAKVGDAAVKLKKWVDEHSILNKVIEKAVPMIQKIVKAISDWVKSLKELPEVQAAIAKFSEGLKSIASKIKEFFSGLFDNIPGNLMDGFANGLEDGANKVLTTIINIGLKLLEAIKNVLGIHSPSTKAYEVGKNFMLGFWNGLKDFAAKIWGYIKSFGSKCVEILKSINYGKIFAGAFSVGFLYIANNLVKAVDKLASPFEGLGTLFERVGHGVDKFLTGFGKKFKAEAFKKKSDAVLNFAKAIGILAVSVWLLSKIKPATLWSTIGALAALAGILGAFSFAVSKMEGLGGFKGMSIPLLAIATAMLILTKVAKNISGMDWPELRKAAIGLIFLTAMIASLIASTKLAGGGKKLKNIGSTLLMISGAMYILVRMAKSIAEMSWGELGKAAVGIMFLVGIVTGLVYITRLAGNKIKSSGYTILKVAGAFALLAITAKIISGMNWSSMAKAAVGIIFFSGIVTGLIAATKLAGGNDLTKLGSTIIAVGAAMFLMAITSTILSTMDWSSIAKAVVGISFFGLIISGLIYATKYAGGGNLKGVASTILMASVSIAILAGVSALLSFLDVASLYKGITAVSILGLIMSALIRSTKGAENCKGNLIVMTVAIGVMAAAVTALSFIDTERLSSATYAMSIMMGAFSLMVKASSACKNVKIGPILSMTIAVAALAGILYLMSKLEVNSSLSNAASLSMLMMSMGVMLKLVSGFKVSVSNALTAVIMLTALAIPLLAFVGILSLMNNVQNAITNALSLSILATAMTILLVPLSLVGSMVGTALLGVLSLTAMAIPLLAFVGVLSLMQNIQVATKNVTALILLATAMTLLLIPLSIIGVFAISALSGVLALTTMAIPLLAFVGVLSLMQNIENASSNAELLSNLMTKMSNVLIKISLVGPLALLGVAGMTALIGLISVVGTFAVTVGAIMDKFPKLEEFLNKGIPILEKIAHAIGSFVGNIIAGFAEGIASSLPNLGRTLSEFMANVTPFINGVKLIDDTVIKGIKTLTGAVLLLTAANVIEGIVSFLNGGNSFSKLGTELSMFITNAIPFIAGAKMIDKSAMEGIKSLSEAILILTETDILQGLTSWINGGVSISDFGLEIAMLGDGLRGFAEATSGIDSESVKMAADAAKSLAEMTKIIPTEGGVKAWFSGETSISKFSVELGMLGIGLQSFSIAVKDIDPESIKAAADAAKSLAEMTKEIPTEGGVKAWFSGETSIAKFSTELPNLGKGLKGFSDSISGINTENIKSAANAAKSIAEMVSIIPSEGGIKAWLGGEKSISNFASKLPNLGEGLKGFSDALNGISTENITSAAESAKSLGQMTKVVPKDSSKIISFGENLVTFGSKLSSYFENTSGITEEMASTSKKAINAIKDALEGFKSIKVSSAGKAIDTLVKSLKNASTIKAGSITGFTVSLSKLGKTTIEEILKNFKNSNTKLKTAGEDAIKKLVSGIKSQEKSAKTSCKSLVANICTAISEKSSSFESAGKDLGDGLITGINSKQQEAYDAGFALGQKAVQGEKDGQKSNSPSKLTIKAGKWLGEGLVIGIDRMGKAVYAAGHNMGETAINSISSSISRISDMVNSDIDSQPTIRPVIDLSDVESGVDSISSMLNLGSSIGIQSRIGSISAGMNRRQNGSNDDVVSALKDLKNSIGAKSGDTYNINGITYDDGSNISDAVGLLVRAARVERRV